ncbi:EcoKI restriction-modification system protein HsdS [Turicibacter sanguinis]|nr:EcoKI restriction-modification system protein HsdS [Turicibacter sanguinis]
MSFKEWKETDLVTIPAHWNIRQLSECINTVIDYRGKTPKKLGGDWSVTPTNYRALSAKNIKSGVVVREETIRYLDEELYFKWMKEEVQKNDILMTSEAPLGELMFWNSDEKIVLSQRLYGLRPNVKIVYPRYLYLYMSSKVYQNELDSRASGTTVTGIRQTELLKTRVILPPLNEQKAIADILSSLDEKIELNNQMNETLEEMAQALFKRWFVDFEFPNEDGQPYKSSDGEMVESELGMIPKGWKNGQLEDICGYSSNKIMIEKLDKNNYISTENMLPNKGGIIEASGLPTTSKVTSFNIGDTLISNIRPYFKKIYYCNQNGGCSNDVLCFNPKLKDYTYCLYLYLYEDNFFDYMMSGSKGTKMPRGDKKQIMRYPIVIANSDIYLKFNKIVSPMFEKLLTLKEENKNLIKLRDTLLPKLMSGEIRVSDLC